MTLDETRYVFTGYAEKERAMALWVDQKYSVSTNRHRTGNEVVVVRTGKDKIMDGWAMTPEDAARLGRALIEAAEKFDISEHGGQG